MAVVNTLRHRRAVLMAGAVAAIAALLGGCASDTGTSEPSSTPSIPVDQTLAAAVPPQYRQDGVLMIANDPSYPPMEFLQAGQRVGADIDLGNAIAAVLGMRAQFANQPFSTIVPSVSIGRYELGISAMWAVDSDAPLASMVTYFSAGRQYAVRTTGRAPTKPAMGLCGFAVSVEEGTELVDMLADQTAACRKAGKPPVKIRACESQQTATALLSTGKVAAMVADTPVVSWAINRNPGKLKALGPSTNPRAYGIAVPRDTGRWPQVVRDAVARLIESGQYQAILSRWSIEQGAIPDPRVIPAHPAVPEANP